MASGKVSDTSESVDNIVDINTTKKIVSEIKKISINPNPAMIGISGWIWDLN